MEMTNDLPTPRAFLPVVQAVIAEFVPIIKKWDVGKYAISVSGSQGKGTWDARSDIDFRLFHEKDLPWWDKAPELWQEWFAAEERWRRQGVKVDGIWPRRIDQVDAALDQWLNGEGKPNPLVWTIWGYHLLPDIYHQAIIEDPFDVIGAWKRRLAAYPPKLKKAILDKHLASVRYWREDYHYQNKVARGDVIFLAGLSSRLVHDVVQILFALNEVYYVGDGQNLDFAEKFKVKPADLNARVRSILYPAPGEDMLEQQRERLVALIDDVILLAA
jgi:hypothetical protein